MYTLVDESEYEYEESNVGAYRKGHLAGEGYNPGVTKTGFLVFDVPRSRRWRLKVYGLGNRADKEGYVQLAPMAEMGVGFPSLFDDLGRELRASTRQQTD